MGVKIICKHVVLPSEPTFEGKFPLSELDQVGVVSHTSTLYFYDRPNDENWVDPSQNKIINTMKESLSRALVPFYPIAGRLSWIKGNRLELECNASTMGAELIEAESSNKISDFGDFVDSSKSMFKDLLAPLDYTNTPIEQIPVLSVQVTRFKCGGICVGMQCSHVVADGRGAFNFFKEWARLARGLPVAVPPLLDRVTPKQATVNTSKVDFADVVESYTSHGNDVQNETPSSELLSPIFVSLTAEGVECLKKVANRGQLRGEMLYRPYSRFEVITAHVWRCMTAARHLVAGEVTALYILGDVRARLDPPLPPSYFGNAVVPVIASAVAAELISKPLSYACEKLREAINQLTNDYVQGAIQSLANEENLSDHQFMEDRGDFVGNMKSSPDIWVTSWLNLSAQGLDFGWGNEIYSGPPTGLSDYRNIMILPHNRIDGSFKVAIWLKREDMPSKFIDLCTQTHVE